VAQALALLEYLRVLNPRRRSKTRSRALRTPDQRRRPRRKRWRLTKPRPRLRVLILGLNMPNLRRGSKAPRKRRSSLVLIRLRL
jgi:hypothetical protein